MYLGIDLGTSNSAIVGTDGSSSRLFKTPEGTDVLPSAIMIDKRGGMMVGKRAYEAAAFAPENVARGFKRLMGTASEITFASTQQRMSPEEASSEILKSLVAQARMMAGAFDVDGAVVTVPAAFNQMQSEATMRAAELAGLTRVALLQEPVAAAMASISTSANKDGIFLVYDLGGGTFDVALVQSISGAVTILGHAGINMLGGQDFDRALLNTAVRPWLIKTFKLPDDFQRNPTYQRLLRVAQYRAELTKIVLSTQRNDRIFADESQVSAKDAAGVDIYLDIEVSRSQLEALISDDIDRSVEHCAKLLKDNGFTAGDVSHVVMIGGPSRMPIVKERVQQTLGIRTDLQTDPMTAVAFGAAIYAEGRDWSGETAITKRSRASTVSKGQVQIVLDYPTRSGDASVRIKIKFLDPSLLYGACIQIDTQAGWSSGKIGADEQVEVRNVPLANTGPNKIRVLVFDRTGLLDAAASQEIVINRTEASSDGMPLMHNIAVKIAEGPFGAETNSLSTLVPKGIALPSSGASKLRAAKDLRGGDDDFLDIGLFEQTDGVVDPDLNLPIGAFRLDSRLLDRGDIIRRGDDIFIHWAIDANGLLNCSVQVPAISSTFEAGKMYVSTIGHKNFDGQDGLQIAEDALGAAQQDIDALNRTLGGVVADQTAGLSRRLDKMRRELVLSHDSDARRKASDEARTIRQEVAIIRSNPIHEAQVVRAELEELVEGFAVSLSRQLDDKINTQVHRLAGHAREVLQRNSTAATSDASKSTREIREIIRSELVKQPGFWVAVFEESSTQRHHAINKNLHDKLVREGEAAIGSENVDNLRSVVARLHDNMPQNAGSHKVALISGLMK